MPFLPMFPLKLVVFPEEHLNLHIFEPRYQELVKDCLLFGIPRFDNIHPMKYGTEVELVQVHKKFDTGESDIKTKGRRRFKIIKFYPKAEGKLYSGAEVEFLEDIDDRDPTLTNDIIDAILQLYQALNINKEFDDNVLSFSTFEMAHHVGFSAQQEYEFLQLNSEKNRQIFMLEHLEHFIPTVIQMKNLQDRVKMNGHFKNLDPLNF